MSLTAKQKRFVEEYLIDLNATQAAIRAGYSQRSADKIGSELLGKTRVSIAIQEAMNERSKRTEITADNVLRELADIAFDDIKNYISFRTEKTVVAQDEEGNPILGYSQVIELKDSDTIDTKNIQEVSMSPKDGFKFKLYDKQKALVDLGKHLKLFTEKVEHSGEINSNITQLTPEERDKRIEELKKKLIK